jgi:hypothetical protein
VISDEDFWGISYSGLAGPRGSRISWCNYDY